MSVHGEIVHALRPVVEQFQRLHVRYCVGGSVASTQHGAGRSTVDVDLSAELDLPTALKLIEALQSDYYSSESAVREAFQHRSCFNLLHLATTFKVDVFVGRHPDFDRSVMDRAADDILGDDDTMVARVASAEDIILIKLEWYRWGDEISERQWDDVLRVARLKRGNLDLEYMRHWAEDLRVSDLLERLIAQADE